MTFQLQHGSNTRSQTGSGTAEFGPAMFILFVLIVMPLIGMFFLVEGAATVYFATNYAAREAGTGTTRYWARENMWAARDRIMNGPLGQFSNITPFAEGMKFRAVRIRMSDDNIDENSSFSAFPGTPDPSLYIYQYKVISDYKIKVPFIPEFISGNIQPHMRFVATVHVEHPEGINTLTP